MEEKMDVVTNFFDAEKFLVSATKLPQYTNKPVHLEKMFPPVANFRQVAKSVGEFSCDFELCIGCNGSDVHFWVQNGGGLALALLIRSC